VLSTVPSCSTAVNRVYADLCQPTTSLLYYMDPANLRLAVIIPSRTAHPYLANILYLALPVSVTPQVARGPGRPQTLFATNQSLCFVMLENLLYTEIEMLLSKNLY